jgi:hypothetical protein
MAVDMLEGVGGDHVEDSICRDKNGNCKCDEGGTPEALGAPAHDLAFAVQLDLAFNDSEKKIEEVCWQPPTGEDGCRIRSDNYVWRDWEGNGRMGTLPPNAMCQGKPCPVCTAGSLCKASSFFDLPQPDFGNLKTTSCRDKGVGRIDEARVLILPAPNRRSLRDDALDPIRLHFVDDATNAEIAEGHLTLKATCTGSDAGKSRTGAGPVERLPRRVSLGVPYGDCSAEVTASAPGYDPAPVVTLTGKDASEGTLPNPLTFRLKPNGKATLPTVQALATPASGSGPGHVKLEAFVSGGQPPYQVVWITGDGAVLTGTAVEHDYADLASPSFAPQAVVHDAMGKLAVSLKPTAGTGGGGGAGGAAATSGGGEGGGPDAARGCGCRVGGAERVPAFPFALLTSPLLACLGRRRPRRKTRLLICSDMRRAERGERSRVSSFR